MRMHRHFSLRRTVPVLAALAALCQFVSATAKDNWSPILGTADDSTVFVDLSRLQVKGHLVRAWSVHNQVEPGRLPSGDFYMSMVTEDEINCRARTTRGLQIIIYAQRFGKGRALSTNTEPDSDPNSPPPNSVGERTVRVVCEKALPTRR